MKKAALVIIAFIAAFTTTSCAVDFNSVPEPPEGIWDYLPEIEVTPEDAFLYEYDSELGGMVIRYYFNESPKIRIPDTIEGEPVVEVDLNECKKQIIEIIMPDTVSYFDFSNEIEDSLQYLNVPAAYTDYGEKYFYGRFYPSLEAIYISDGVEQVVFGNDCYGLSINREFCENLKKVYLPDSVTRLGYGLYDDGILVGCEYGFAGCKALESVRLPAALTELGDETFIGCESLKNIKIPDGVTALGDNAFEDCTSLESVSLPDSVTELGDSVFKNCASLESINLPDSVTTLGKSAFENCTSLKSVSLSNGLTEIAYSDFRHCESLESIKFPDSITVLEGYTFASCYNLKNVTLNEGLTEFCEEDFCDCESLENITIPKSVTGLGLRTFWQCPNLKNVVVEGDIDTPISWAFGWGENLTVKYQGKTYNYSQLRELD